MYYIDDMRCCSGNYQTQIAFITPDSLLWDNERYKLVKMQDVILPLSNDLYIGLELVEFEEKITGLLKPPSTPKLEEDMREHWGTCQSDKMYQLQNHLNQKIDITVTLSYSTPLCSPFINCLRSGVLFRIRR